MDAQTLKEVMEPSSLTLSDYERLLPGYENAMRAANITNANRAAMFAAQIGHESSGLYHMEEIASGHAYNGRADLGNIHPGDGPRFKGSGPIQLTGRNNFRAFTKWANEQGHTDIDFEAQPHLVRENPKWGFLAASWYWVVARPNLNKWSDERNILNASREINGWFDVPNGMPDRTRRWNNALAMGDRLLPGPAKEIETVGYTIEYSRNQVAQDTVYNCGPASVQTIVQAVTGEFRTESEIGGKLGTHTGGTDYIGSFPDVLNGYIAGGQYRYTNVPDYLDSAGKDVFWDRIKNSVNANHGVVVNVVAPPSNYPKAVSPSTISPAYSGGTVYHYFAVMGWEDEGGFRKVWVADSGFSPYGYWLSFDQLCSLVVPKGYAYSTADPVVTPEVSASEGDLSMADINKIMERLERIETESKITNEQLAGPERDGHGNLKWTGWEANGWPGTDGKATVQRVIERLETIERKIDRLEKKESDADAER